MVQTAQTTFEIWYQLQEMLQTDQRPKYRPIYLQLLGTLVTAAQLPEQDWLQVLTGWKLINLELIN